LLFTLAAYVAVTSVTSLLGYSEPKPTFLGIAILVAAAAVMPWLAKEKRRLSGATGSAALKADAAQSALCGYLSPPPWRDWRSTRLGTSSGQTRVRL
jgi:divalent metal cation (Fe/Co/Zn/Cd) transporter